MTWSFITQFKIEFLLPFTSCRNKLEKMSDKFYPQISEIHGIYYLEKIYDLKKSMFYSGLKLQSDFLKLRNFYYDLVPHNRRWQNHKNKNVEEKPLVPPGKCFPQSVAFPHPLKANEGKLGHYDSKSQS